MRKTLVTAILILFCSHLFAQTYYYELVSTTENGIIKQSSGNGFYTTFGNNCCYDSDSKGNRNGSYTLNYKGFQNERHKYSGESFWGNSAFYFSNDYNTLVVKSFKTNNEYKFKRLANSGKETTHKPQYAGSSSGVVVPTAPIIVTTPSVPSIGNTTTSTVRTCPGCGGSGICTSCHGAGGYWVNSGSYTGSNSRTWVTCGVCHGSGRCGVCHGKGSL